MAGVTRYRAKFGQPLSRKQAALMEHLIAGRKLREIVAFTGMARGTICMHYARIKEKLGARTITQAAALFDRQRGGEACRTGGIARFAAAMLGRVSAE